MQYVLVGAGDGCEPFTAAEGAVAWVSESGCSFFTKVRRDLIFLAFSVMMTYIQIRFHNAADPEALLFLEFYQMCSLGLCTITLYPLWMHH